MLVSRSVGATTDSRDPFPHPLLTTSKPNGSVISVQGFKVQSAGFLGFGFEVVF